MSGLNYNRKAAFEPTTIYTSTLAKKAGVPYFGENVEVVEMYDKNETYDKKKVIATYAEVKTEGGKEYTMKLAGQLAKKIEDADRQGIKKFDVVYIEKSTDGYHQIGLHVWGVTQDEVAEMFEEGSMATYNMSFDEAENLASSQEVNVENVKKVQDNMNSADQAEADDLV